MLYKNYNNSIVESKHILLKKIPENRNLTKIFHQQKEVYAFILYLYKLNIQI